VPQTQHQKLAFLGVSRLAFIALIVTPFLLSLSLDHQFLGSLRAPVSVMNAFGASLNHLIGAQ